MILLAPDAKGSSLSCWKAILKLMHSEVKQKVIFRENNKI